MDRKAKPSEFILEVGDSLEAATKAAEDHPNTGKALFAFVSDGGQAGMFVSGNMDDIISTVVNGMLDEKVRTIILTSVDMYKYLVEKKEHKPSLKDRILKKVSS